MTRLVVGAATVLVALALCSRRLLTVHEPQSVAQSRQVSLMSTMSARFVGEHLLQQLASEDRDLNRHNALYSLWNGKAKRMKPVVTSSKQRMHQYLLKAKKHTVSSETLIEKAKNDTILADQLKKYASTFAEELAANKAKAKTVKTQLKAAIQKLKISGALDGPQLLQRARIAKLRGHKAKAKRLRREALSRAVKVYSHQKKMDKLHSLVQEAESDVQELKLKQQSALQKADGLRQESIKLKQQAFRQVELATKMRHEALAQNSTTMALASQVTMMKSHARSQKRKAKSALHHSFFWQE